MLENLVRLAVEERVAFVLLAGDLYDGDWRDYQTGLFLVKQMGLLRDAGIRVFLISGNHDAENKMTRSLKLPDNVHRFPTDRATTERLDEWDVALHGQGFANAAVKDNLVPGYPAHARAVSTSGSYTPQWMDERGTPAMLLASSTICGVAVTTTGPWATSTPARDYRRMS